MSTSTSAASTAPPHRVRLSVPAADVSTMEWLKHQDNISQSLRFLVRDYIERNGYTDPTSRPVRQLPRRGRPPLHDDGQELDQQELDQQEQPDEQDQQPPRLTMVDELGDLQVPTKQAAPRKQPVVAAIQTVAQQGRAAHAPAAATPAATPAPAQQSHDPGSTPGASGVGSFLSASRGDDD